VQDDPELRNFPHIEKRWKQALVGICISAALITAGSLYWSPLAALGYVGLAVTAVLLLVYYCLGCLHREVPLSSDGGDSAANTLLVPKGTPPTAAHAVAHVDD